MEYCIEAKALKSSLLTELTMKSTQQACFEDFSCFNSPKGLVSSDDFAVDCFFDFSNGDFKDGYIQEQHIEEEEEKDCSSVSSQDRVDDDNNSNFSSFSDSFLSSELAVPVDDLAEQLEWVSRFVDDSLPEVSLLYPVGKEKTEGHAKNRFEPESKPVFTKTPCFFPFCVPAKARTKRPRPTGRTWSIGSPITDSSTSSTSSSSSTSCLIFDNTVQTFDMLSGLSETPMKKPKKKPAVQTGGITGSAQFQRRCSHCQVQKTPQWRTGPLGAKTLCNACGVRYKSGRLFPEYRPACSPTFSGDIHSNSHRKVLEMRKKKDVTGPESRPNQMIPSF